jgi:tripartite-type tricarboxylate transporter receptor subunit TctC
VNGKYRVSSYWLIAALAAYPALTFAQDYPSKPIRYIIPSAAGGGADILGRIVAPKLTERFGQQVVIDNRPGAGTIIGSDIVAKAAPDGYTIMTVFMAHGANPYLHKKLPYDTVKDFAPVTLMATVPSLLVIYPGVPARSVSEFIALAKAKPGQLNYGTAGIGTANHLTMELFKMSTGTDIVHVPYKGGLPPDLLAGQLQAMFITLPPSLPHVKAGRLVALGISSNKRATALPDVPTVAEAGVAGFEVYDWQGVVVPAGTPKAIIARLHREIIGVLDLAEVRERISGLGADVVASTSAEFSEHIHKELLRWEKVIKQAGIRAD